MKRCQSIWTPVYIFCYEKLRVNKSCICRSPSSLEDDFVGARKKPQRDTRLWTVLLYELSLRRWELFSPKAPLHHLRQIQHFVSISGYHFCTKKPKNKTKHTPSSGQTQPYWRVKAWLPRYGLDSAPQLIGGALSQQQSQVFKKGFFNTNYPQLAKFFRATQYVKTNGQRDQDGLVTKTPSQ